jgi:cbb3-type cytochrome oxidase maturation protein
MSGLLYLIPIALALGLLGLAAFLWALRSGQSASCSTMRSADLA